MMVMTAKVDLKKMLGILAAVAAGILLAIVLLGADTQPTVAPAAQAASGNEERVQFLKSKGWDVTASPVESSQVRIPTDSSEVFDRYNLLQKSQGYDLTEYAGKKVMRYVYRLNNYPGATEPVYATVLVCKNRIIGGDVTDTAAKGAIRGFDMPLPTAPSTAPPAQPPVTAPTNPTAPVQ